MDTPEITAYLKTHCGWSAGVRAVLAKYNLKHTEKDIIQNPAFRWEMETKSGQPLSPCVEINGKCWPISAGKNWKNIWSRTNSCSRASPMPAFLSTPLVPANSTEVK